MNPPRCGARPRHSRVRADRGKIAKPDRGCTPAGGGFAVASPAPAPPYCRPMRHGLPARMIVGLLLGLVLGSLAHLMFGDSPQLAGFVRYVTEPAGKIFLRLLFMLVIPLIVSALAIGVAGLGDLRSLGRIGLKTLAYTVVVSTVAVLLGVGLVNLVQPGRGLSPELRARLLTQ